MSKELERAKMDYQNASTLFTLRKYKELCGSDDKEKARSIVEKYNQAYKKAYSDYMKVDPDLKGRK